MDKSLEQANQKKRKFVQISVGQEFIKKKLHNGKKKYIMVKS